MVFSRLLRVGEQVDEPPPHLSGDDPVCDETASLCYLPGFQVVVPGGLELIVGGESLAHFTTSTSVPYCALTCFLFHRERGVSYPFTSQTRRRFSLKSQKAKSAL